MYGVKLNVMTPFFRIPSLVTLLRSSLCFSLLCSIFSLLLSSSLCSPRADGVPQVTAVGLRFSPAPKKGRSNVLVSAKGQEQRARQRQRAGAPCSPSPEGRRVVRSSLLSSLSPSLPLSISLSLSLPFSLFSLASLFSRTLCSSPILLSFSLRFSSLLFSSLLFSALLCSAAFWSVLL